MLTNGQRGAILCACLLVGCGPAGEHRVPVHGSVRWPSGEAVAAGGINFQPHHGHAGPSAAGDIIDGRYRFTAENGPTPGRYRVVVSIPLSKEEMFQAKQTSGAGETEPRKTEWIRDVTIPQSESFEHNVTL